MLRLSLATIFLLGAVFGKDADMILHNGKVVTVDERFSVTEAVAVKGGKIVAVGTSSNILANEQGSATRVIDLKGKTVLPGLIDAHVHPLDAGLSEFRRKLPALDSISAIQSYILDRAKVTPKGEWIIIPRTLPPRLKEMRMPTRMDLDVVKEHPVAFDGSYVWSANSLALKISNITAQTPNPPGGEVVKGPDGEPNGILRNASGLLKGAQKAEVFTEEEKIAALEGILQKYAESGLTTVWERFVENDEDYSMLKTLKDRKGLPVRVVMTWRINSARPVEEVQAEIRKRNWMSNQGDDMLRFSTLKITLDGGQSVGTAYQRMPYGPFGKQLYGQTDPDARGTLFVDGEKLFQIYSTAREKGWQLTAHAQGGAAIDTLIDVFERLDKQKSIAGERHHVMHGSFMSEDAIARMKRLNIAVDAQPGWMYFDVPALGNVFGLQNMKPFFPLKSFLKNGIKVAGGSDHMIGFGKDTAVNPFNPFLNMWMCTVRKTREGADFYPEERVTREEALRMYSIDAAWMFFGEKERGSIEKGKLADLVVIDRDYMTIPLDEIRSIQPLMTIINGKVVYEK